MGGASGKLEVQKTETTTYKVVVVGSEYPIPPPKIDPVPESGMVRTIRDKYPASFFLEIGSYSCLREAVLSIPGAKSYESDIFEAGGERWRLSLYPDGDKERNGTGYISLYLIIEGTDSKPPNWIVNVDYKFFVHDQTRDKYLTIQDASREIKRFYAMKKEWGFAKLLSHADFNDATNGYLIQDKCVFGVEILVHEYKGKRECLPVPKKFCCPYTWKVHNFSTMNEDVYYSDIFTLGHYKWKLCLYPKGQSIQEGKSLSLFLSLDPQLQITPRIRVLTEFKLYLKNQKDGIDWERRCLTILSASCSNWGFRNFLSINDLQDVSKGFLVRDTLIIQVQITRISTVETFA